MTDGNEPFGALLQAADGNFYGTTLYGGSSANCSGGCGTIFKIMRAGTFTTLHSFDYAGGANPYGALVQAPDGTFYGTTSQGGNNGYGILYRFRAGVLTSLHTFSYVDGANPAAGLLLANGILYGTTAQGGAFGAGTVFKITPAGKLTTLHSFDQTDGAFPQAALIQATDGNFYGTTYQGGTFSNCFGTCGTVFKITPTGQLTTIHSFDSADGANPFDALLQGTDGNLYANTELGGTSSNCTLGCGTLFRLTF